MFGWLIKEISTEEHAQALQNKKNDAENHQIYN